VAPSELIFGVAACTFISKGDRVFPDSDAIFLLQSQALKNAVLFVILAPFDNEQSDLLHRIFEDKKLVLLPAY
jgi:hypothetical protein